VETGSKIGTRLAAPLQPYVGPAVAAKYPDFTKGVSDRELQLIKLIDGYIRPQPQSNP